MDPEKTGGFGYMGYLDKINIKRGSTSFDDSAAGTERMNKTFYDGKERDSSPKNRGSSTARASNIVSNYGSEDKIGTSLKDMYFREPRTEKGDRPNSKFFRVNLFPRKHLSSTEKSEFVANFR